ncbi:WhiB family transcriptional regulator [Mycobacterium hackensackense]|nr:WhiB family transcriptional regulator [Mycobacterium hackensackense]
MSESQWADGRDRSGTGDWRNRARCRDSDPDLFFHPDGERSQARRRRLALAREICTTCPVKWECAGFALDNGEDFGIWGGMSETDRARLFLIQDECRPT